MTDEKRKSIRAACVRAKEISKDFLADATAGKILHEMTNNLIDMTLSLADELDSREIELGTKQVALRDALVNKDEDESYHIVYTMVDPQHSSLTPWAEAEIKSINHQKQIWQKAYLEVVKFYPHPAVGDMFRLLEKSYYLTNKNP